MLRFDGDGRLLQLASEAYRIRLGHLFDPLLAVHCSLIEALPHQILAVYQEMLTRQPLRFLLADDPGAGKTIMAGLLIRELIARGDVRRCLICAPGNLTEQWQAELSGKFQLEFTLLSRDLIGAAGSGNPFTENDRLIMRLDQISRNEALQNRLRQSEWDLIVCDEAHKMSASYFGGKLQETKRYKLGKLLGELTRHLLLMTATPHNGKDDDFDLFMKLLDPDRFEGRARAGARRSDARDMMRRLTKEQLLTFEGKRLFPERKATTLDYALSAAERQLYEEVTDYVRNQFNRIEELAPGGRKSAIGFALTILQRRLASSPAAIYHSLRRRREKLEARLKEARARPAASFQPRDFRWDISLEEDWEELPDSEAAAIEAELVDHASAASTTAQLSEEIEILRRLEAQAQRLRQRGTDNKWRQLLSLLQEGPELKKADGSPRKLVIFTEHRDTLDYLKDNLLRALGRPEAVQTIHGGLRREERRRVEEAFRHDPAVQILLATDAAGEGINLQSAHLMVNYDLPWNPNRLEQRFGRIHRIGQREVCHLWNLVAGETREGAVYRRLLSKLATERDRLNGQVFDVIGELFHEKPLRQLLVEALRYGDMPAARAKLHTAVDKLTERRRAQAIARDDLLSNGLMDTGIVEQARQEMERANARRLQPHFIADFFKAAFAQLGGKLHERESGRYAISFVPARVRQYAEARRLPPIARLYRRICFDKALIHQENKPEAAFVCRGHALLDAVIGLTLSDHQDILKRGAMLVDPNDPGQAPRVLLYLESSIQDAAPSKGRAGRVISQEAHFVEMNSAGAILEAGAAPYLDYRPASAPERAAAVPLLEQDWLNGERLQRRAINYALERLMPRHLQRVKQPRIKRLDNIEGAVHARLTREIYYWDGRADQLRAQERAGKVNAELNSRRAQRRADALRARLQRRKAEIARERHISAVEPIVAGAALILPSGLLPGSPDAQRAIDTRISEKIAMDAVMAAERQLGNEPRDVSHEKRGYDIESKPPGENAKLRFIEVKGRRKGAADITLTKNELFAAFNSGEQFILALVEIEGGIAAPPRYVNGYDYMQPKSAQFSLKQLIAASSPPR